MTKKRFFVNTFYMSILKNASFDRLFIHTMKQSKSKSVALVLAHPDDESMFMTPLLDYLQSKVTAMPTLRLHMLTLSSGNAAGKGMKRRMELHSLCLKYKIHCKIIDDARLQDGPHPWDVRVASKYISDFIHDMESGFIVTFDEHGVSKHPNHMSTHSAVKLVKLHNPDIIVWQLLSLDPLAKYIPFIGIIMGCFGGPTYFSFAPLETLRNMQIHSSQLQWHVYLWSMFSTYAYVNSFTTLDACN